MQRTNTKAIVTVLVLLIAAAGVFGYTWYQGRQDTRATPASTSTPQEPQRQEQDARIITAQHAFSDGEHTIAGELDVPTPCHLLETETFFIEGDPRKVELRFTTSVVESDEVCAQVITPARFKVTFEAPQDAAISATLDGEPVVLNLVDVPQGESLDEFEVFIKG